MFVSDWSFLKYVLSNSGNNVKMFIDVISVTQYLCSVASLGLLFRSLMVNIFLIIIYHNCLDSKFIVIRML